MPASGGNSLTSPSQDAQKLPHGKPLISLDHGLTSSAAGSGKGNGQSKAAPVSSQGPPDSPPPSAASGNGLPSVNIPKGGGAIRGTGERFSVSPATGTVSASVPLPITPGRSGFTPELSLSYDSGSGNGVFGFGWQLGGIPTVGRKTDTGMPTYDDASGSDTFVITGSEDLVPELELTEKGAWCRVEPRRRYVDGVEYTIRRFRPRIEASFARIESWTVSSTGETHWRSISRGNHTTLFGEDASSRIVDPGDPSKVFRWLASSAYDDRGNAMVFEYKSENSAGVDLCAPHEIYRPLGSRSANKYLKRVKYGNKISTLVEKVNSDTEWLFELVFDYGDHHESSPSPLPSLPWPSRSDPFSNCRSGFELRTYRLCRRVLMFHHFPGEVGMGDNTLVASLNATYTKIGFQRDTALASASCATAFQKFAYVRKGDTYIRQSLPPIELQYSKATISGKTSYLSTSALEGLPLGIQGDYQFIDLEGEGVPGIVAQQYGSYYYKANLGHGNFAPPVALPQMPTLYTHHPKSAPQPQWLDLEGDGHVGMVRFDGPTPGFYKRAAEVGPDMVAEPSGWQPFKQFISLPNLKWQSSDIKLIDLTGDGHADVLVAGDEQIFTVYPSLQEDGFGPPSYWRPPLDENRGPRLIANDGTQAIYTADMTGDGLSDWVRIGYHDVCYWPNLGYGRFGTKVVMTNAPHFDSQDHFKHSRLRLADIDGSGTTDLVYLNGRRTMVYLNQAGNGWSAGRIISAFPPTDDTTNVQVVDLLAKGTGCLVWSSTTGSDMGTQVRYVDLMEAGKPYLIRRTRNNLGFETRYSYASSAEDYLADKAVGNHWITKVPFPVQVVKRMETFDYISKNRFATRYAYHDGYYDGIEKEFRGFGMVETWDTEDISTLKSAVEHGNDWILNCTNSETASTLPPVLTKTWFHTGASFPTFTLEEVFACKYNSIDIEQRIPHSNLPTSIRIRGDEYVPHRLALLEQREAFRALKGSVLHSEIYSADGTSQSHLPYTVNQANFHVELLQPVASGNQFAVFHTRSLQSMQAGYDRRLYDVGGEMKADPRIAHSLTLKVDDLGNVLEVVALSYGRRYEDSSPLLSDRDHETQKRDHVIFTQNRMTNAVNDEDNWLTPLSAETHSYELFNLRPLTKSSTGKRLIALEHVQRTVDDLKSGAYDLPYGSYMGPSFPDARPHRRLLQHSQSIYRANDLSRALPVGVVESLALPFQNRQLAISQQQIEDVFVADGKLKANEVEHALETLAGYDRGEDGQWWTRTARMFLSLDLTHSPAEELEFARHHFFISHRAEDVFSSAQHPLNSLVIYDKYDLLVQETIDPLGNRMTVGERSPSGRLLHPGQNYRLLQPGTITDPNGNVTAVAFDTMGMFAGSAVMGKPGQDEGDSLEGFMADLDEETVVTFYNKPMKNLKTLLGNATSRIIYDYHAFYKTRFRADPQPVWSSNLSRERHVSQLAAGEQSRIMVDISYSDGFDRVIQHKVLCESEPLSGSGKDTVPPTGEFYSPEVATGEDNTNSESDTLDPSDTDHPLSRWIGSGWTVYNNKGAAVRQFEPFFSFTHRYESSAAVGVSPIVLYDPIGRVIASLSPDHTWTKVRQDPWRTESWDANDTVMVSDPANDVDVGGYFRRLQRSDYLPTWYSSMVSDEHDGDARRAAERAAAHADTPRTLFQDAMGRTYVAFETVKTTFSDPDLPSKSQAWRNDAVYDVQGNQQKVHDSFGRLVSTATYTYSGGVLKQTGFENGGRWALADILGKTVLSWDGRGQRLRMVYDDLRRPTDVFLSMDGGQTETMVEKSVYGESKFEAEETNARTRIVAVHDQAGITFMKEFDFKGNILQTEHNLAKEYRETIDWSLEVELEEKNYVQSLAYDALNRVISAVQPDGTMTKTHFNLRGLQERVMTRLRGENRTTPVIVHTEYDAKGQRTKSVFGNGTSTAITYNPRTFRTIRICTRRKSRRLKPTYQLSRQHHRHRAPRHHSEQQSVQDLVHSYDAMGNLTSVRDDSQQNVWHHNTRIQASQDFIYDSTYRLIEAWGREHLGGRHGAASGQPDIEKPKGSSGGKSGRREAHPSDHRAMGRYIERYHYDLASNVLSMEHLAVSGGNGCHGRSWTRLYGYEEPSSLENGVKSNRLSWTRIGRKTERYAYEGPQGANGGMTTMPKVQSMTWDFRDRLASSSARRRSNRRRPLPQGINEPDYVDVAAELGPSACDPLLDDLNSDSDSEASFSCSSDNYDRSHNNYGSGGRLCRRDSQRSSSGSSARSSSQCSTATTITYYRSDYTGKRVRKVCESVGHSSSHGAQSRIRLKETIYVGGAFEVFRKYNVGESDSLTGAQNVRLELETAQILGSAGGSGSGNLPVLRAEFLTVDLPHRGTSALLTAHTSEVPVPGSPPTASSSSSTASSSPVLTPTSRSDEDWPAALFDASQKRLLRFAYSNLQGSSTLELDADGRTLTREEYTPFGTTSFSMVGSNISPSQHPKRFRYAGAERDDSTGLYCMGARYYAAWLGRWTSADPSGLADGLNSYVYGHCNPTAFTDPSGHSATTSAGATLQANGRRHDRIMKGISRLLDNAGITGKLEVTVKAGQGGSRLDWLRTGVVNWARGSVELKTTNMWHYFDVAADGKRVLDESKVAGAVADYARQINRHSGHLHEYLNSIKKLVGLPAKREALVVVARGFRNTSPEFKAFASAMTRELGALANGPVASAVIHAGDPELKAALKVGGQLLPRGKTTEALVGIVQKTAAAARAARMGKAGGFVSGALIADAGKVLVKGAKVLGAAGLVVSSAHDVLTLTDKNATTGQKALAGVDLAANAMMASGVPPLEAAGAGLSIGGAVGGWVDHKVEAAITDAGGSKETAKVVGEGAGVLAGAATGAVLGATVGLALGPGGAVVGAAIGGAAGAIGAALKIHWGS